MASPGRLHGPADSRVRLLGLAQDHRRGGSPTLTPPDARTRPSWPGRLPRLVIEKVGDISFEHEAANLSSSWGPYDAGKAPTSSSPATTGSAPRLRAQGSVDFVRAATNQRRLPLRPR